MISSRIRSKLNRVRSVSRRASRKIGSRSGASLTVALLFFIVCAVIGSVVLAAGTAAAGRYNRMSESDLRYYSVTSAAELFRDAFDGASTTVERSRISFHYSDTPYTVETDGSVTAGASSDGGEFNVSYLASIDGQSVQRTLDLLHDEAINVVFGPDAVNVENESCWNYSGGGAGYPYTVEFKLVPSVGGVDSEPYEVKVTAVLDSSNKLTVTFENANDTEKYTLKVVCTPQINEELTSASEITGHSVIESVAGESYTERDTVKVTEKKITTVRWSVGDIISG